MHHGGAYDLPLEHLADASSMGNAAGELYGVSMAVTEDDQIRLALIPVTERLGEDGAP
ncbi:hypothetical protein ABT324_30845 [Saccharopolyspora sp. NPDC000359]|uniref:hypothetical protein n=1 Tax=Saccharopolyspora sp. NPDC000359 TaxID=3154251 RepID=UPI0033327E14